MAERKASREVSPWWLPSAEKRRLPQGLRASWRNPLQNQLVPNIKLLQKPPVKRADSEQASGVISH